MYITSAPAKLFFQTALSGLPSFCIDFRGSNESWLLLQFRCIHGNVGVK